MPTTIDSAGIIFNDATSFTSAVLAANSVGATQITNGSVTAVKLGTNEQKQICKAWGIFDGVAPVSILGSYNINIAGITRITLGQYRITFETSMADANYCVLVTSSVTTGASWNMPVYHIDSKNNNNFEINFSNSQDVGVYRDSSQFSIAVFA